MGITNCKNILHIITAIDRGGAENHLVDLIDGQVKMGHTVQVAYLKGKGYWKSRLENLGVVVVGLGLRFYGDLSPVFKLRKIIKEFNLDIVHAHLPPAELYTRFALFGLNKYPFVITKHVDGPFLDRLGVNLFRNWVAKRADKIITISNAVNNYLLTSGLVYPEKRMETIYYGLSPDAFINASHDEVDSVRSGFGIEKDTLLFGVVARLVPQKSLDTLLDAFAILNKSAKQNSKLLVVGEGMLEDKLKKQAKNIGIESRVIWAGYKENIAAIMNSIDVFVLTSIYEGFGLVLLEAMASSKPIIASNIGAIPEVVEDSVTGILVPPKRADLFADAMLSLCDVNKRTEYGASGKKRLKRMFSLEKMISSTNKVYTSVLGGTAND